MSRFISGKVISGKGKANIIISLDWVQKEILEKLGFKPYPGTLNLKLSEDNSILLRRHLSEVEGIIISKPDNESISGICYKVLAMHKFTGALVLPNVPDRRDDIVEVISPYFLRKMLRLENSDEVVLEIL